MSLAEKAFLAVPAALALSQVRDGMTRLFEDGAAYILLADSILHGGGYRAQWVDYIPRETHFPPLLPLLLVPIRALFGGHLAPAHIMMAAFYFAGVCLAYVLLKKRVGGLTAAVWTAFIATSPVYVESVSMVNSELPFVAASLAGLLVLDKRSDFKGLAIACLFFTAAFYLRTIGFVLFIGGALFVMIRKDVEKRTVKAFFIMAFAIIAITPWSLWTKGQGGGRDYIQELFAKDPYSVNVQYASLSDVAGRIKSNVVYYPAEYSSLVLFEAAQVRKRIPMAFYPIAATIIVLTLIGWIVLLRERNDSSVWYLPVYFGPILPWFWQYVRFLHPVLLVAGTCMAVGTKWALEKILPIERKQIAEKVMIGAAAVLLLGNVAGTIHHLRQPLPEVMSDFYAIHEPLKSQAAPGEKVATRNAAVTNLLTGLKTESLAIYGAEDEVYRNATKADWLILSGQDPIALATLEPLVGKYPLVFQEVAHVGTAKLYKIAHPAVPEK